MQDAIDPKGPFTVGVSIVVVPDGFTHQGGLARGKLSLSLSPTSVESSESVASVDIRFWPEQIAPLARMIRLHIEGQKETFDRKADLDLTRFQVAATKLWRRIFSDGAGDVDSGFRALLRALNQRDQTTFDKNAPVESSPIAELERLIDGMSGSAIAASLLQRAAAVAVGVDGRATTFDTALSLDAAAPGAGWWDMLREEWLSQPLADGPGLSGDGEHQRLPGGLQSDDPRVMIAGFNVPGFNPPTVFAKSEPDESALGPVDYLMAQIGEPGFWRYGKRNGEAHLGREAVHRFRQAQPHYQDLRTSGRTRFIEVADKDSPPEQKDPLRDNANRKYAGLLCFPTLAKYVGLIVDTTVEADYLLPGSRAIRTYGKIAASFTPLAERGPGSSSPPASQPKGSGHKGSVSTHAAAAPHAVSIVGNPRNHVWTAYVVRRPPGLTQYEYFGPQEIDETAANPGGDGLLKLSVDRFELCTLDVTNAAEKIMDIAKDSEPGQTLESSRSFPELLTRGIMLVDKKSKEEEEKRTARRGNRLKPDMPKVLYAEDLSLGYRIDVVLTKKIDPDRISREDARRWRTLVGRSVNYGRDIDREFLKLDVIHSQRVRDDGHVRPMTRQDGKDQSATSGKYRKVAHQELFT